MKRSASRSSLALPAALGALAAAALLPGVARADSGLDQASLKAVRAAALWVAEQAKRLPEGTGVVFPEYAESPEETGAPLYSGGAGVLIFLENAGALLEDEALRALADRTAAGLLGLARETEDGRLTWAADSPGAEAAGLYTGDPGIGQAFLVRARIRGSKQDLEVAAEVAACLAARVKKEGAETCFGGSFDIIAGASGALLFLLEAHEALGDSRFLDAALGAGRWLAAEGLPGDGTRSNKERSLWWPPAKGEERHYPGFSHGTAGTAYALARLAAASGDRACLDAALAGARWLLENGKSENGGLCWHHYSPGHEDRFMEGWCHGPSGTGRLFLLLADLTGQKEFAEAARRSAAWIMKKWPDPGAASSEARFYSPSLCCGAAGVLDFFVDLHRATGERRYAAYAREVGAYLEHLAKPDGAGLKWTNYDRPDEQGVIYHGVSLMIGTSGEAFALLRLATLGLKEDPIRHLPDRRVTAGRRMGAPPAPPLPREEEAAEKALQVEVETPEHGHGGDGYVVLTNRSRKGDPFFEAASELCRWRGGKLVTDFDPEAPERVIPLLREAGARHVALVLPKEDIDTNTQRRFLMAAARLDEDIFLDVGYGFITGTKETAPLDLVARAKALEERGSEKRWIGTGVASQIKSVVYEGAGDPAAQLAGFSGRSIYWGSLESDPEVLDFVKRELPEIEGGGFVDFGGCGDPEGIWLFSDQRNMQHEKHWPFDPKKVGHDPKGEMPRITADLIRLMHLENTVVFTGVCHIGTLHRVFVEGDIVSTFGTTSGHTEYVIPEGKSVAAAMLDTGVAAYICPIGPNHGYRTLQESQEAFERQLSLGDVLRSTYDDIAVAQGKQPELDLYVPGKDDVDAARGAAMYGGGANRTLYGDPALRPFRFEIEPAVAVTRAPLAGAGRGFQVEARVLHQDYWQWNMFTIDGNAERIRALVALQQDDAERLTVTASARDDKGAAIQLGRLDAHVECMDGGRVLHLQAAAPRGLGLGEVGSRASFVVRERK
ncbi:MAG: hypothetical protein HY812_19235 [Planctomycetes bacterium]|nr:hypothetical protein [Planctomycetota bacterium]